MIEFGCKNCGQKLSVQDQHSGKRVKCPKCGSVGVVPDNSAKIKFNCKNCGQRISVPQIHAGKKGKCPKCKSTVVVPTVKQVTTKNISIKAGLIGSEIPGKEHFYSDLSLWSLLIWNLIAIIWALIEGWSLYIVMWIYWSQSFVIGILWFKKILNLEEYSMPKGFPEDDGTALIKLNPKIGAAICFLSIYGFLHLGYAGLLWVFWEDFQEDFKLGEMWPIFLMTGFFLVYQFFSFFHNKKWVDSRKHNLGLVVLFPFARIIPFNFILVFGAVFWGESLSRGKEDLALFMLGKTMADVIMHGVEQRWFGRSLSQGTL